MAKRANAVNLVHNLSEYSAASVAYTLMAVSDSFLPDLIAFSHSTPFLTEIKRTLVRAYAHVDGLIRTDQADAEMRVDSDREPDLNSSEYRSLRIEKAVESMVQIKGWHNYS